MLSGLTPCMPAGPQRGRARGHAAPAGGRHPAAAAGPPLGRWVQGMPVHSGPVALSFLRLQRVLRAWAPAAAAVAQACVQLCLRTAGAVTLLSNAPTTPVLPPPLTGAGGAAAGGGVPHQLGAAAAGGGCGPSSCQCRRRVRRRAPARRSCWGRPLRAYQLAAADEESDSASSVQLPPPPAAGGTAGSCGLLGRQCKAPAIVGSFEWRVPSGALGFRQLLRQAHCV